MNLIVWQLQKLLCCTERLAPLIVFTCSVTLTQQQISEKKKDFREASLWSRLDVFHECKDHNHHTSEYFVMTRLNNFNKDRKSGWKNIGSQNLKSGTKFKSVNGHWLSHLLFTNHNHLNPRHLHRLSCTKLVPGVTSVNREWTIRSDGDPDLN